MRRLIPLLFTLPACFDLPAVCDAPPCPAAPMSSCSGQCAPFAGGPWAPVLVADAPSCPAEAPFAALALDAPPLLACGAPTQAGDCSTPGYVCLPASSPPWSVCVVRDGAHPCPTAYPVALASGEVSICCPADAPAR